MFSVGYGLLLGKRTLQIQYIKGNNGSYHISFHIERSSSLRGIVLLSYEPLVIEK